MKFFFGLNALILMLCSSQTLGITRVEVTLVDRGDCDTSIEVKGKNFLPKYTKAVSEVLKDLCKDPKTPSNFRGLLDALNVGVEEVMSVTDSEASEEELERIQKEVQDASYDNLLSDASDGSQFSIPAIGNVSSEKGTISIREGSKTFVVAPNEVQCTAGIRRELELDSADEFSSDACYYLFDQFVKLYGVMQGELARPGLSVVSKYLSETASRWASFRKEIKPQTPWEMVVNRAYFIDEYNKYFKPPPAWQIVLAHPSIAYDIVPSATDGDQNTEAFVIEGLGIHWWGVDRWYIPSGFSVVGVYADRASQSDWRPGLAVYFDRAFTIGATYKDQDYGVFLSVDLVEVLQDREELLDKFGLEKVHQRLSGND